MNRLGNRRFRQIQFLPGKRWLSFGSSLLLAPGCGVIFFQHGSVSQLESVIMNIGLDAPRTQLVVALMIAMIVALIGTLLGRSQAGALLGSGAFFSATYLANFLSSETRPFHDPGGLLEPLNQGALFHTILTMVALALLSAFVGTAVGKSLARVVIDPPLRLLRWAWQRLPRSTEPHPYETGGKDPLKGPPSRTILRDMVLPGLGTLSMLALILLASNSSDLFLFAPDIGLHNPPAVAQGHASSIPMQGTVVTDSFVSAALNGQRRPFLIYLPPSYNTPEGRTLHYPTLYLLHGTPGNQNDWIKGGLATQSANTLIDSDKIHELIIVSPDGNGRPGMASEWGNSPDHKQLMETSIATDLVRYVDQHYRTIADPEHRAIGGLSMGGFGAANIAIHHPDVFGTFISLGGYYVAEGSVWGKSAAYRRANSPLDTIATDKKAWKLLIYLGAATQDQPYYNDTKQFIQELKKLHIPYHLDLQPGSHAWSVWQTQLYDALRWITWR